VDGSPRTLRKIPDSIASSFTRKDLPNGSSNFFFSIEY
jgi:hypothetical protein